MKKNILDRKFKHHKWFKEGVTVAHAIDYFAKSGDFYLSQKPSKKQSSGLFDDTIYDDIITDGRCTYRMTQEEVDYYLERKDYWKAQKEKEHQEWLDERVDVDKKLSNYLCMNTHYDIEEAEKQLHYWKYEDQDNEIDKIDFWEKSIERKKITKGIIDSLIAKLKNSIQTNREFEEFKKTVGKELKKVVIWNGRGFELLPDNIATNK